jgi:uncharacterized membrane protein YidH (DUF202 family)
VDHLQRGPCDCNTSSQLRKPPSILRKLFYLVTNSHVFPTSPSDCPWYVVYARPQPSSQLPNTNHFTGKRISLPTRVEPKVFFANERTFLSWLNFTVILGGLAVGLLNFGDNVGKISAGLFTVVAMATMIYALFTYHWRARSIRMRGQGGFDDRWGPSVLALALLAAVIVNFVLRVTAGN